jgi:hypothetical protein
MNVNKIIYRQKALEDIAEIVQYFAMENSNLHIIHIVHGARNLPALFR